MEATPSPTAGGLVNPSNDGADEYYTVTATAKISNGKVNLNENSYVYLNASCSTPNAVGYLELYYTNCGYHTYMSTNGGGYQDTNQILGQFIDGVATFKVYAKKIGNLKLSLSHPGNSTVPFTDNEYIASYLSNPAAKFRILYNYDSPYDNNSNNDQILVRANGQSHGTTDSYNRITIQATDANDVIDINFGESNIPVTLSCAEVLTNDDCVADLTSEIDGNSDGSLNASLNFTNGVATLDILTTEVGQFTLTVPTYNGVAAASATFQAVSPIPNRLVEDQTMRDETVQGKVTFFYQAEDRYGNKVGDFSAAYMIGYDINNGTLSGSSDGMFFSGGTTSYTIETTIGQTVNTTFTEASTTGFSVYGYVDGVETANQNRYHFAGGKAVAIRITQQPIAQVKVGDTFQQAMVVDIIDASEAVVAAGADSVIDLVVTAYSGLDCTPGNEINSISDGASSDLNKTTASGTATWSGLESTTAQQVSFKVKDSNSRQAGILHHCDRGL